MSRSTRVSGPAAAQAPPSPPDTDRKGLDECVNRLHVAARTFAGLPIEERLLLARAMRAGFARVVPRIVEVSCRAKRIVLGTALESEEWALGPYPVLRQLRLIIEALTALRRGRELPSGELGRTIDGRAKVGLYPGTTLDALVAPGMQAEVHIRAGIGEKELFATQAQFYRRGGTTGRVALVLGAGNATAPPIQDALTKMFNEGRVCLLKLHPLNGYLGPVLAEAFADPIERHFLAIVYGGAEEGAYLAQHPGIDEIHLTGTPETHEDILWGSDPVERAERKARHLPRQGKVLTSQLGGVAPVLIVPGPYLDRQLAAQAEALAGAMVQNAGYNCYTPRLLVTPRGWTQRDAFLRHLERALARAPLRLAYYPGAIERWERLTEGRAVARMVGAQVAGMLPWTIVPGLDPSDRREPLFSAESFCPILGETEIGSADAGEFLQQAVGFVNERVWGTLAATLIVHPRTLADHHMAAAVERAIVLLRYGAVGVNVWPAHLYSMGSAPWGGHPSSGLTDMQSGRGWMHNTAMLEEVEKAVVRQPLVPQFKPAYIPGPSLRHTLMRRLTSLERGAGWAGVPGVLEAAIRS